MSDAHHPDDDRPLEELQRLALDADTQLIGRVERDINRRTLAANSLEFSLNVMLATVWAHVQSAIASWPGLEECTKEDQDG